MARKQATVSDKEYMSLAARLGCRLCEHLGLATSTQLEDSPCELHHPRTGVGAGLRAPHGEVIPLCSLHHRGPPGIHGLGRKRFEKEYGVTEYRLTAQTQYLVAQLRGRQV